MKIKNIKILKETAKSYDLAVDGIDHTYELNDVFVHNSLRVPKQYFGDTDDSAGFSGGESLALISSRYAKMIKRIQNTFVQAITDAVNLMLLDKKLDNYINKFTIKMQPPTTSEEKDRRENLSNKIAVVNDIMALLTDIEDPAPKLKILKALLSNVLTDSEVTDIIQKEIEKLENSEELLPDDNDSPDDIDSENINLDIGGLSGGSSESSESTNFEETEESSSSELPSPEDLGVDMTNNNNADFD